uniref:Disease resistance R13L4/SHOC-2-like LRR domain-containing protein n=1 Tax=Triticum urartu TaxID=4572 RepID=A0A8R7Q104_TRIUA
MDIGCLIHLRFLSLRKCSRISEIPGQIRKLQHLQTLDLTFTGIKRLPGTIARLRQLVHLLIPQGVQLPVGIGNMESLEELYWFDVKMIFREVVLQLGNMTKLKDVTIN